jgi:hypothetical protein
LLLASNVEFSSDIDHDDQEDQEKGDDQEEGLLQQAGLAKVVGDLESLVVIRDNVLLGEDKDGSSSGIQVGVVMIKGLSINREWNVGLDVTGLCE